MIKSFSLPRVCTYTVHASLEEDASAWKIANYVFYFCENHLLLLLSFKKPCVRGFELYQLQLRLVTYAHLYFFPMIVIYILLKY